MVAGRRAARRVRPQRLLEPLPGRGRGLAPVALIAAELAGPLWQLGARWYDFLDEDTALAIATERGRSQLWSASISRPARDATLDLPFVEFAGVTAAPGAARCVQALPDDGPGAIVLLELGRRV